jgi:hypothetical protein
VHKVLKQPTTLAILVTGSIVVCTLGFQLFLWRRSASGSKQLTPTPSPVSVATPPPTSQPTPTATLAPSRSPSPSPTVSPKPTPKPSLTPSPTITPSPSITPSPTPISDIDFIFDQVDFAQVSGNWSTNAANDHDIHRPVGDYKIDYFYIRNNGHQAGEKIEVKFTVDGIEKKTVIVEKIDPGTSPLQLEGVDLPNSQGTHQVKVVVNLDKKISETRYDNNEVTFKYTLE